MPRSPVSRFSLGLLMLAGGMAACTLDPLAVDGAPSKTMRVALGQELQITLVTVGPGHYDSLPLISSQALRYLDMTYVEPFTPGGPRQLYRFETVGRGEAVIRFQHTADNPDVSDTVEVY